MAASFLGRRVGLRIGFGLVLATLFLSCIAAYRIQDVFSRRSVEIHHKDFVQQEQLNELHRISLSMSIVVRDMLMSPQDDRDDTFERRAKPLRKRFEAALARLQQNGTSPQIISRIESKFAPVWQSLEAVQSEQISDANRRDYIDKQFRPRRHAATMLLTELEEASRNALYASDTELTETRRSAARTLLLLLGLASFLGCLVTFYSVRHSEKLEQEANRQFKKVSEAKRELERLSARLMDVQEEERMRLSRELHDEIVQNLAVARLEVGRAGQLVGAGAGAEQLDRARSVIERTTKTVRNIMLLLRPSLLDDLGLVAALQWLAEDFERRTGVTCQLIEDMEDEVPQNLSTGVFRVVQESLHNAEKYAQARKVVVKVAEVDSRLLVEIRDDGVGFDVKKIDQAPEHGGHFGLIGMRERATALGGQLHINATPDNGTTIVLSIPLPQLPDREAQMEHQA